jgi:predicted DNA-binding protein
MARGNRREPGNVMTHGEHNERQTAFRLPEDLLAWLRDQAKREDRTMTAIVRRALEEYRRTSDQPR